MKKLAFLLGFGVGFLLGSKAGHGPYQELERQVRAIANRQDVQEVIEGHEGSGARSGHGRGRDSERQVGMGQHARQRVGRGHARGRHEAQDRLRDVSSARSRTRTANTPPRTCPLRPGPPTAEISLSAPLSPGKLSRRFPPSPAGGRS